MTSLDSVLLGFVDARLDHMLEAPEMWGSAESVELQVLQLLEVRALALDPDRTDSWRSVQADYERFLAAELPGSPPTTLAARLGDRQGELTTLLRRFVAAQRGSRQPARARYEDLISELMSNQGKYSWDEHPEAVLGTIYLYFSCGTEVPPGVLAAFVARHQDEGRLNEEKVSAAISAVARLDGGPGLGASQLLRDFWSALAPLRPRMPPRTPTGRTPARRDDGR